MRFPKFLVLASIAAVAAAVSVGAVSAQQASAQAEEVPVITDGAINDGRVNSTDLAARVIVYCNFEYPDAEDPDAGVLSSVELWGVNGDGYFEQVLVESAAEIDAVGVPAGSSVVLATNNGFSLYRETDGSFTATAPGDAEGKVYLFNWERGDQNC